jgi:transcriptional regulator with XRE-family HTH domain
MSTLIHFPLITDGRFRMATIAPRQTRNADPNELSALRRLGELFQRARLEKKLSDRELGKLAGISRQHVRFAIAGGNITILMLLRLTRALQIPSRALSDLGLHVFAALRHIEEAATHLSEAAALLGGKASEEPRHSDSNDTDARAAALVREVMAKAKTLGPNRLSVLDETLRGLVASAEQPGVPAVREKRSGTGWPRPK